MIVDRAAHIERRGKVCAAQPVVQRRKLSRIVDIKAVPVGVALGNAVECQQKGLCWGKSCKNIVVRFGQRAEEPVRQTAGGRYAALRNEQKSSISFPPENVLRPQGITLGPRHSYNIYLEV